MQQKIIVLAAACLCIFPSHVARADAKSDAKQGLQAAYRRYGIADARSSIDTMQGFMALGMPTTDEDGKAKRPIHRMHRQSNMHRQSKLRDRYRIVSLRLYGNKAMVTAKAYQDGSVFDKSMGKMEAVHFAGTEQDLWIKSSRKWQLRRSEMLSIDKL